MALDKGFAELVSGGLAERQPRLVGVRADRCQPLVRAWLGAPAGRLAAGPSAPSLELRDDRRDQPKTEA